jgi:hypothetical protein
VGLREKRIQECEVDGFGVDEAAMGGMHRPFVAIALDRL